MSRSEILRQRSLLALLAAEVVSTTGSQMTWLALPWFVLITTGSATKTSLVMAAELGGLALLGLPAGRLLGRLGARRTMILCDSARAPLMLVIPVLHWSGGLAFPVLFAVAFALGALSCSARGSRRSQTRAPSSRRPRARPCSPAPWSAGS